MATLSQLSMASMLLGVFRARLGLVVCSAVAVISSVIRFVCATIRVLCSHC